MLHLKKRPVALWLAECTPGYEPEEEEPPQP
eukprot:COSAG01_NODE_9481_length_2435_cov_2.250856_3_plen_31_part_00